MYPETEKTTHPENEPPLPPPAHFDLEHLATAKPVQRLSWWQRSVGALQRIFGPQVIVVAVMVAGSVIGFIAATSVIDVASPLKSAGENNSVASSSQRPAEEATVAGEVEPTSDLAVPEVTPTVEKALRRPVNRIRRTPPPIDLRSGMRPLESDEDADQKPKPRLVSIIH